MMIVEEMTLLDMMDSIEKALEESAVALHHCIDDNRAELEKLVLQARGHIRAARTLCRKAESKAL